MGNHLFRIALLIAVFTCAVFGKTHKGESCRSLNSLPGICKSVESCHLTSVLRNKLTADASLLKSVICGEDSKTGKTLVCCPNPVNDADGGIEDSNVDADPSSSEDNKIYFPDNPISAEENDEAVDVDDFHSVSYESHRNFHLLPTLNDCGSRASLPFERIIGGTNAGHAEYPWLAQIGYRGIDSNETIFDCGGSVLTKNYILTAAHCLQNGEKFKPVVVRLAEYNMSTEVDCSKYFNCSRAKDFEIESLIIHGSDDIALIKVKQEIPFDTPFIRPICLPFGRDYEIVQLLDEDSTKDKMSIAAGWGKTNWEEKNGSDTLQTVFLPIHTYESCKEDYEPHGEKISPKQICAGGEIGKDTCNGDSGGPIMIPLSIRTHKNSFQLKIFQLGIISYGPTKCGEYPYPGIAIRVTAYLDWILNNISS